MITPARATDGKSRRQKKGEGNMKKFFATVLVLAILAGGYMVLNGKIDPGSIINTKENPLTYTTGKAETATVREESTLDAAKRIDDQIWNGIRRGDTNSVISVLAGMGYSEEDARSFIASHTNEAAAMNKRHVHILAEAGDVCVAEAVHYLVTFTNGGKDSNQSNSGYWLYMRKKDGKWETATSFSEEEVAALDEVYQQLFRPEAIEAGNTNGNFAVFGNKMWTQPDGVYSGVFTAETAYMYQENGGDVIVVVKLANGTNAIQKMTSITVTMTDEKLGQLLKATEKADVSVLPGTVEMYEVRVPASKVRKGTWGSIHSDVHIDY